MQSDSSAADSLDNADSPETEAGYDQGFRWREGDPGSLGEVVEAAFDYRGDVTVLLRGEEELAGYLANRFISEATEDESWIEMFPSDGGARQRISLDEVRGLSFSGKDVASGKSWETWLKKYTERKEAVSRGEEVENIDLFPDELG